MKWLEIIKLRSAGNSPDFLEKISLSGTDPGQNGLVKIEYYRHAFLDTDLSVHLEWDSEKPEKHGSTLGLHLARALKDFGLIDHSIWIEKK
jgi:hypothetical protein